MKKVLFLFSLLFCFPLAASASICSLFSVDSSCSFVSDTSNGTALYTNPSNLSNIGSGTINPFLGTQTGGNGGTEFGVSTDLASVNILPLDDKRDNANTFTQTFQLSQLGFITIGGVDYFPFFLDINEPNSDPARLLSIDTLRIWGRTGADTTSPFLASSLNVTSSGLLDTLNTVFPDLTLVYALGPFNTLVMDYNLFAGSGLGYDLSFLVPTFLFSNLAPDSRLVFSVGYGGADAVVPGTLAQDGFEEWAFLPGSGPRITVPEPNSLLMLSLALVAMGIIFKIRSDNGKQLS